VSPVLALSGGSASWYVARATGIVTLGLLTASVLIGILTSFRWSSPTWPRFVVEFIHRNVSLLVLVFLAVHVVTVVADGFAPIRWIDVVVPFVSAYRPFWLGLGAVAFDLLLALVVTSLVRHRLGYTTWRLVHWLAYLCWPVAVLHGLGTGSDTKSGLVLLFTAVCVVAVLIAAALRVGAGLRGRAGARAVGFAAIAFAPVLLVVWLVSGPLADGWARKAGTPASALAAATSSQASPATTPTTTPSTTPSTMPPTTAASAFPAAGFDASASGTVHQSAPDANGETVLSLTGSLSAGAHGHVDVELTGDPLAGGGVSMRSGTVTLSDGKNSYRGDVVGLGDAQVVADMPGPNGASWRVNIDFTQLDQQRGTMAATVHVAQGDRFRGGGGGRGSDDR
jgi:DMSO/TMAO reductase YedYZ heme-binding membrane subunit